MSLLTRATKALKKNEDTPKKVSEKKPAVAKDAPATDTAASTTVTMAQTIGLTAMLTEKGMRAQEANTAVFRVKPNASKGQIYQAIFEQFGVRPLSIRTARFIGKVRRRGSQSGVTPAWKKAFVKVADVTKLAGEEE